MFATISLDRTVPENGNEKIKAQGISDHAGYFFAEYGCFPYPDVTELV